MTVFCRLLRIQFTPMWIQVIGSFTHDDPFSLQDILEYKLATDISLIEDL